MSCYSVHNDLLLYSRNKTRASSSKVYCLEQFLSRSRVYELECSKFFSNWSEWTVSMMDTFQVYQGIDKLYGLKWLVIEGFWSMICCLINTIHTRNRISQSLDSSPDDEHVTCFLLRHLLLQATNTAWQSWAYRLRLDELHRANQLLSKFANRNFTSFNHSSHKFLTVHCICINSTSNSWKCLVTSQHPPQLQGYWPINIDQLHLTTIQDWPCTHSLAWFFTRIQIKTREESHEKSGFKPINLSCSTSRIGVVRLSTRTDFSLSSGKLGSEKNRLFRTPPLTDNFWLEQTEAVDRTFSRK